VSSCAGESDRMSEHSSGSVFLSSSTDKPSLLSSLFHHLSREPDVVHRSVVGQKLADSVPPRATSPVAGEKSRSLPVERTQQAETSRPLSVNVTAHLFGTPAIMRRVNIIAVVLFNWTIYPELLLLRPGPIGRSSWHYCSRYFTDLTPFQ